MPTRLSPLPLDSHLGGCVPRLRHPADDEDTEITNYDVGEEALDRLAIAMGGKTMVPVLFENIQRLIKSADWKHRHAALMAISQSGEGCEKQMASNLEQILVMIVEHFGDAHPRVRWAAINTVGQMCTDFGPTLQSDLHQLVLPSEEVRVPFFFVVFWL